MNVRTPQPDNAAGPLGTSEGRAPIKFLYPTGSQPLDGYTIKRGIGRGGFGEVYFATSDAGKEVALKLIRRNLDVELRGVKHCLNLKHPNLIAVYDIRTDSLDDQWVVMEYVSGESLEDAIERHPDGMPVEEVIHWMQGICAGVAYLHDHGIVHRDLKPGNVFLDHDSTEGGTVKIGDYGLSKFISCSRRSGQTESVGTVHYMAPEIANGRYGREIDTYALGIILYEMLTGHVPFEGESVGEVLMKHLTAEPNLEMLAEPFREIVRRTLAKDPAVRIASVGEMVSLLPGAETVQPAFARRIDGWSAEHAAADGIGSDHLFADTSVRGAPALGATADCDDRPSDREPIYDWVSTTWCNLLDSWHAWQINRVAKALVLLGIVGVGVVTVPEWGGVAAVLGFVYLIYYLFWAAFVRPVERRRHRRQARPAAPSAPAAPRERQVPVEPQQAAADVPQSPLERRKQAAAQARRLRMNWKEKVHKQLCEKTLRQRGTELLSAMVWSGIVCTFLSLLAVMLIGGNSPAERVPLHMWLTSVSTVGCWVVLATIKFTEGRFEDQIPMRLWQLVGGAVVGLVAWSAAQWLLIGVPNFPDFGGRPHNSLLVDAGLQRSDFVTWHGDYSAAPDMLMTVMYFALVMVGLRWWRLGEYARRTRLSLVAVGLIICGAWIAHLVCWYPQPAGVAVFAVIAVATQLVSPWLPPSGRKALAEEGDNGVISV